MSISLMHLWEGFAERSVVSYLYVPFLDYRIVTGIQMLVESIGDIHSNLDRRVAL